MVTGTCWNQNQRRHLLWADAAVRSGASRHVILQAVCSVGTAGLLPGSRQGSGPVPAASVLPVCSFTPCCFESSERICQESVWIGMPPVLDGLSVLGGRTRRTCYGPVLIQQSRFFLPAGAEGELSILLRMTDLFPYSINTHISVDILIRLTRQHEALSQWPDDLQIISHCLG